MSTVALIINRNKDLGEKKNISLCVINQDVSLLGTQLTFQ